MLVLSRKALEQILIPELEIRITILSVGKNRVQLGIEAPKGIQITRPEVTRPSVSGSARHFFIGEGSELAAFSGISPVLQMEIQESPAHDNPPQTLQSGTVVTKFRIEPTTIDGILGPLQSIG